MSNSPDSHPHPRMTSNLSAADLDALGFAECGVDVRIDHRVAVFNAHAIRIGSHVRIDAFTVIAGGSKLLTIGSFVHLGASCYVSPGDGGITIGDFCTLAPRVSMHGHSDDYLDGNLTGGIVPADLTGGVGESIVLEEHVIIGSATVVLPGVTIGHGAAVGALSLIRRSVEAGTVVAGNPQRVVGTRKGDRFDELADEARRRVG
jgi:dTDP-4-amino-4,6-dideoxy-D-glucose acyltransferase